MSEQYRCSECGHFVEIPDDAICDVCNIGIMQHLRYTKGGDGSHWDGCEEVHWDCRIAQLEAELARLTALVERLKEDAERLAKYCQHIPMPDTTCWMSSSGAWNCNCGATEAFYIHRTLMKELE